MLISRTLGWPRTFPACSLHIWGPLFCQAIHMPPLSHLTLSFPANALMASHAFGTGYRHLTVFGSCITRQGYKDPPFPRMVQPQEHPASLPPLLRRPTFSEVLALGVLSEKPHYFHLDISASSLVLVTAVTGSHSPLASELPQKSCCSFSTSFREPACQATVGLGKKWR